MGQFQKGQSGNPGGKPKEKPFRTALTMELKAAGEDHKKLRELARNLIRMASIEDGTEALPAIKEIWDRLEGKAAQAVELTGEDGGPIQTEDVSARDELLRRIADLATRTGEGEAARGPDGQAGR